nr:MAG TPA: hypothetical protein [Caudoviricetes sp.]
MVYSVILHIFNCLRLGVKVYRVRIICRKIDPP